MRKLKKKLKHIHLLHKEKIARKIHIGLNKTLVGLRTNVRWLKESMNPSLDDVIRSRYESHLRTIETSIRTNTILLHEFEKRVIGKVSRFHSTSEIFYFTQHLRHFSLFKLNNETLEEYDERISSGYKRV